jgi:hypothetical protein
MWPKMGLIRPDRATSFHSVMLPVLTDALDPTEELRRLGIAARLAWHADSDSDALVLIESDPANLRRLESWAPRSEKGRYFEAAGFTTAPIFSTASKTPAVPV